MNNNTRQQANVDRKKTAQGSTLDKELKAIDDC